MVLLPDVYRGPEYVDLPSVYLPLAGALVGFLVLALKDFLKYK